MRDPFSSFRFAFYSWKKKTMSLYPSLEELKLDEFVKVSVWRKNKINNKKRFQSFRIKTAHQHLSATPFAKKKKKRFCPFTRVNQQVFGFFYSIGSKPISAAGRWQSASLHGHMPAASVGPESRFVGHGHVPDTQRLLRLGAEHFGAEQQDRSRTDQQSSVGRSHERCP